MSFAKPIPIRDLMDFYRAWPNGRARMVALLASDTLDQDDRTYLEWLILLADRVGPEDLDHQRGPHGYDH